MSPQLGGHARDLEIYVHSLKICDGEPLVDYYTKALHMYNKISIQNNQTGQKNKLILRCITLFLLHIWRSQNVSDLS